MSRTIRTTSDEREAARPRRMGHRLPRRMGVAIALAALAVTAFAPLALASHGGATVDCGSSGTFTLRVTETGNGDWQAPGPFDMLLFEEGGAFKPLEVWVNGSLRFSNAAIGRDQNALTEVQCT